MPQKDDRQRDEPVEPADTQPPAHPNPGVDSEPEVGLDSLAERNGVDPESVETVVQDETTALAGTADSPQAPFPANPPFETWATGWGTPVGATGLASQHFVESDPLDSRRSRAVMVGGLTSLLLASMGGIGTFLLLRDPAGAAAAQIAVGDGTTTTAPDATPYTPPTGASYVPLPTLPIPTTAVIPPSLPTTTPTTAPRGSVPTLPNQPPVQNPTTMTTQAPSTGTAQVVVPHGIGVVYITSQTANVSIPYTSGGTYYSNSDGRKFNNGEVADLAYSPADNTVLQTSGNATLSRFIRPPANEGGSGPKPIFLKAKGNATGLKITGNVALIEYWDGSKKLESGTKTTFPSGTVYIAVFPQSGSSVNVVQA